MVCTGTSLYATGGSLANFLLNIAMAGPRLPLDWRRWPQLSLAFGRTQTHGYKEVCDS